MPLRNISEVTRSMINLIQLAYQDAGLEDVDVYSEPPARLNLNGVGFYLYHVVENTHYKNLPAPPSNQPPIRFAPMGLNLYYQLSANSTQTNGSGGLREQQLMGIAMKALHDYPEIDDQTALTVEQNGTWTEVPVLAGSLHDRTNRFRISLLPIPPEESVSFWTAGESPLKFSAYYEVSVVLLEPEEAESRAARVLDYSVVAFTEGAPRLLSSYNILSINIPEETEERAVRIQPAQVPAGGQVNFVGAGFSGPLQLLLFHAGWDEPAVAGESWAVQVSGNQIVATVQTRARLLTTDEEAVIFPGIYAAQVRVARQRALPGEELREFHLHSNLCPFTISPRVEEDNVEVDQAQSMFIIRFNHVLTGQDLEVHLGGERLAPQNAGQPENGFFRVSENDPAQLEIRWPESMAARENTPMRVFINGTESPPLWRDIP